MSARFPAQDTTQGREPQAAPETPRRRGDGAAINDLVRKLRDELGLAIAPRDHLYSPSKHNKSQGDILYNKIQSLYWREKDALYAAIEECKFELTESSPNLSAEERTDLVFRSLRDLAWLADNRIHQPSHRASSTTTQALSDPEPVRRLFRRVDSGAGPSSPSAPTSPLVMKKMTSNASNSSTNARDSFWSRESFTSRDTTVGTSAKTSANTSFAESLMSPATDEKFSGSSIPFSQVEDPTAGPEFSKGQLTESIAPTTSLEKSPAKRRRSDGSENLIPRLTKKANQEPRQHPEPPKSKRHFNIEKNTKQRHHKIAALATSGHFIKHPYVYDRSKSFVASFERARIMHHASLSSEQVSSINTHSDASTLLAKHREASFQYSHPSIWNLPNATNVVAEDTKLVLSATAKFNAKNDTSPMFQWNLNPIRKETKSTHLARHFGFDRFLTITFPSLTRDLPAHLQGQRDELFSAFMEWILKPKFFLGRVWRVFFSKEHENKAFKKKVIDNSRDRDFFFFAISGDGIGAPVTYFDFMNWMIPFKENAAQSAYKLFARIPLYLSRTTPTVQFTYDQIRFVDDIKANGAPEDTAFEDPAFKEACRKVFDEAEVMTDGCARISVGAMKEHSRISGMPYCHGAIQGRINGHKGLWIPSAPENTQDPDHLAIWIELRPSQAKLKIRNEDRDVSLCEKDRWSFNVVKQTRPHQCSVLHRDFLQLLEERHVPREDLLTMIEERIKFPIEEWNAAMSDPARWVVLRDKYFWAENTATQQALHYGLPRKDAAKTDMLMDKAGFLPTDCLPLAKAMQRMQEFFFQKFRSQLRFLCSKSTYLQGVPDPENVLEPGEVHLLLTQPFVDEATEEICDTGTFKDKNVLVTRHPSGLRSSDMQKVRCICHPSLAHLKDVIVMSTRGEAPFAAKLQGGDYDGDEFWICGDQRIVKPFMNAPVLEQRSTEDLGITQKKERLMDIVDTHQLNSDQNVESWLRVVLPFACQEQQLGVVTNRLNDLAYYRNLSDPGVCLLADLHDLIMDTSKNGYVFNKQDFTDLCRKNKGLNLDLPRKGRPAYLDNIEWKNFESDLFGTNDGSLRTVVAPNGKTSSRNILDVVVFKIMNPKIYDHLKDTHETYVEPAQKKAYDDDLQWVLQTCPVNLTVSEKRQLDMSLDLAYEKWGTVSNIRRSSSRTNDDHAEAWQECIDAYDAIHPPESNNRFWASKHGRKAPSEWDCYKVGVLASARHYLKKKTFMMRVAADTVRYLKSLSTNGQNVMERANITMKARKPKDWATIGTPHGSTMQPIDGNDDDDDDESMFGFDEGAFDAFG